MLHLLPNKKSCVFFSNMPPNSVIISNWTEGRHDKEVIFHVDVVGNQLLYISGPFYKNILKYFSKIIALNGEMLKTQTESLR